ncbi:hypothetical protein RUM44_010281 [Polyplax serrata]|uniref:Conserved oligomeric Golgi complex subunit 4 n=1 Tax=Polyplax serrata TaxID=468196 RepID=A0ABR1AV40_POLSC
MSTTVEEDMQKAFEKLNLEKELINKQLDGFISRQYILESKLKNVGNIIPKLQELHIDAEEIAKKVHHTAAIAENVSEKVRRLDVTRSLVSECQQRVHDLLDLQLCSEEVQAALKNEDYEKAAAHVHRVLSIDQSVLQKTADNIAQDHTTVDNSFILLKEVSEHLRVVVAKKFKEAIADEDLASVERFFKIYPLLNMHEEGLKEYSLYLSSKLRQASVKNIKMALDATHSETKPNIIFADTITLLLEGTARVIETHQPLVDMYYGHEKLIPFYLYIQEECDSQANKIVTEFLNYRNVKGKIRQVNEYQNNSKITDKIDPKSLDILLGELTMMHYKVDLYFKFVKRKLGNESKSDTKEINKIDTLIKGCDLNCRMQEVLDYYIQLERYFTEESVFKAVAMDALVEDNNVSSMVDDVFFILRKSIRRASTSGSVEALCSVINNVRVLVETKYCPVLKKQLEQGYSTGYLDVAQAYTSVRLQIDPEVKAKLFLTYLNNSDVTLEYLQMLKTNVNEEIALAFPHLTEKDKEKVGICLSELVSTSSSVTSNIIAYGMKQLRESAIKPRLSSWFASFSEISYELTEEEFGGYETNEPFVRKLISKIDEFLTSFKETLTTNNYDSLVNLVAIEIARYFEKVVLKTKFNRLGGLAFDKEVRSLVSFLASTTSWSVRDKFSRLTQISTLLNLERLTELSELGGQSGVDRLKLSDVKKVLSLRTDFSRDEIENIKL